MSDNRYSSIKKYYDSGFWDEQMVRNAVKKEKITEVEFEKITGKEYDETENNI